MTEQGQHPHTTNGRGVPVPGATRAGNRRAPEVVSAKRPRELERRTEPVAVEERVGPPPGRPSFGLTRRSR